MADQKETPADEPEHTPDFELPRHGAISEDTWPEYQARGFQPIYNAADDKELVLRLRLTQGGYGTEHVYTGDAYDETEQRPLRHKPGIGVYVDPDGLVVADGNRRKQEEWHRKSEEGQGESDGGPSSN
jgi:hypothetical protein